MSANKKLTNKELEKTIQHIMDGNESDPEPFDASGSDSGANNLEVELDHSDSEHEVGEDESLSVFPTTSHLSGGKSSTDVDNTYSNQSQPSTSATQKKNYVRIQFNERLEWTTLDSTDYDYIKCLACKSFPDLLESDFEIQDVEGATIGPSFIDTFLNISPVSVILNFKSQLQKIINLDKNSPFSSFSSTYVHDTSSCSTETLNTLPSSPSSTPSINSFVINFDNEDFSPIFSTPKNI
ncbi:hypothetical protein RN001_004501 [Aquatica leii]|uniref:Uncharacterized protein n=1 Tax=Aquatica leii TaxID=1421715 RepID=A0AAN7Q001_9COLE|nr:hypothetical protein RN001_004501 [Aquatica leii]